MTYFGVVGLLVISVAIWIRSEKTQNIFFIIGGALLLIYSVFISDIIFIILQAIFILSALIELVKKHD